MAAEQVVERVNYKCSLKKKDLGTPGTFTIGDGKLLFDPNDSKSDSKLEVKTHNIKSHKYSTERSSRVPLLNLTNKQGRSHIIEFENYPDIQSCRQVITKALAKFEEEPKKPPADHLSIADVELRIKLLRENRELRRLHKQFVESKVLMENEFWATRKKLLGKDSIRQSKQQVGLKSMIVSGIKPSTDGQTNRVTFNITPEIIFQIFSEKPAVRQAFIDYVPSKVTMTSTLRHPVFKKARLGARHGAKGARRGTNRHSDMRRRGYDKARAIWAFYTKAQGALKAQGEGLFRQTSSSSTRVLCSRRFTRG